MDKKSSRLRRAVRTRKKYIEMGVNRLVVHRTNQHIYAQLIAPEGAVVAAASTVEKEVREAANSTGNIEAAKVIGKLVAERSIAKGIEKCSFDRSGFKYHGRVKALADAAREAGLQF